MRVHLLLKHPPYPYNYRMHIAAATVEGVFTDKAEAERIATEKNARKPTYLWTVETKQVREKSA